MNQKMGIIAVSAIILILLVLILIISFRPRPESPEGGPPPTEEVAKTDPSPTPLPVNTDTPAPVPTAQAGSGASPASSPAVVETKASALSNLNLREGPGTNYPVAGSLPAGSSVTVVGRNQDGTWLVVDTGSSTAWLSGDSSLVRLEGAALTDLPFVEAPVLPYNLGNPQIARLLNQIPLVLHNPNGFTCVSHAGINNLMPLREGNVIGPHAGDFVYNHDNVLFKYQNGSLNLIKENPIARFDGGAESLPFSRAMQLVESGEIVWTGTLGQSPGRGVPGCDPAVR